MGKDAKAVLHHTASPRETVVEDSLLVGLLTVGVRLLHPCPEREGVVPN